MPSLPGRLPGRFTVKIAHRIRIAYALFLLPLLYLAVALASDVFRDVSFIERELVGSRYAGALRGLQDEAQRRRMEARPFSAAALAERITRIENAFDDGLDMRPAVTDALQSLSPLSPLPEEEARRILRTLIVTLVDRSSLTLDSRLDSYYLIEALFVKLPELVDRLGRVAQLVRGPQLGGFRDSGVRDALSQQRSGIRMLVDAIDRALDTAVMANTRSGGHVRLTLSYLNRMTEVRQVESALARAENDGRQTIDLEAALGRAIDAIERLRIDGDGALEALLTMRVEEGWRMLELHAGMTTLLFAIGALFLFVAVERGVLRPIHAITALMRQLARGDVAASLPLVRRRDEIGAMFDALGVFKDNALVRVEQERALRHHQDALVHITRQHLIGRTSLSATLDAITRAACETLGVDRAVVVSTPPAGTPIVLSRWHATTQRHDTANELASIPVAQEFLRLVAELMPRLETRLIVAIPLIDADEKIPTDARAWLAARGVKSGIVAGIMIPGRAPGFLTLSSIGRARHWTEQDVAFARALAELVASALLDHGHRQALTGLDLVDEGLHGTDATGEVVYANRMSRVLAGVDGDLAVPAERLPALAGTAGDADGACRWHDRNDQMLDLEIVRREMPDQNVVTVIRDVTARKRQERERRALETELRQAAKMEAIGRLAGGVAHDFNNALGTIIGYTGFLLQDLPVGGRERGHAERLMKAVDHAKEIVRQILTYSRGEATERRVVDLRPLVADIGNLVRASLPASTQIDVALMADPAPALVNESEIHQIILNLCINANDAFDGAPGRIAISLDRSNPRDAGAGGGVPPATVTGGIIASDRAYVCLMVADDGTGMDQETLSRIFEPFFTTKERGRGTGLGLAVVHGIITAHGGAYVVESRLGQGTSFAIYLPLEAHPPTPRVLPAADSEPRGQESVLVIDDDGDLLGMMALGLERLGYEVTSSSDPVEALAALAVDPEAWDIVVSDQVMPGMKGLELLAEIARIRTDCPVILCTGFSDSVTEARAYALGAGGFFLKPVEPITVARRIRALLDR